MSKTVLKDVTFSGVGLHSGKDCTVALFPTEKKGIYFKTPNGLYNIDRAVVCEDQRLTGFMLPDGSVVRTAEHMLAAISGMGINDVIIESHGGEIPILDGSAYEFASALKDLITDNSNSIENKSVSIPVLVDDIKNKRSVMALPSEKLTVTYIIDYSGTPIGTQHVTFEINTDNFLNTISKARTFCLTRELDYLKANGLGLGGSLDNAMVFDDNGMLNENGFRVANECANHKVIDILGDLTLLGSIPIAHYIGICAGHAVHNKLADKLRNIV